MDDRSAALLELNIDARAADYRRRAATLLTDEEARIDELVPGTLFAVGVAELRACARSARAGRADLATPSSELLGLVQVWAQRRYPLVSLIELLRILHEVVAEEWLYGVDRLPDEPGCSTRGRASSRFLFRYFHALIDKVARAYAREWHDGSLDLQQQRLRLVQGAVGGDLGSFAALDYAADQEHLALIGSGPRAEGMIRAVARTLDARVLIAVDGTFVRAWLGRRKHEPHRMIGRVLGAAATPDVALAIGGVSTGLEGFARSHEQALEAHQRAGGITAPLTFFHDVALEALASGHSAHAQEFMRHELGELVHESPRNERLRETLQAYFASSLNAAAAAGRLRVHEQTVAYRMRQIEHVLGHAIHTRRAELEVALRLWGAEGHRRAAAPADAADRVAT